MGEGAWEKYPQSLISERYPATAAPGPPVTDVGIGCWCDVTMTESGRIPGGGTGCGRVRDGALLNTGPHGEAK